MKTILVALVATTLSLWSGVAGEDITTLPTGDKAPRWFFLGEDDDLKRTYRQAKRVAMICIFETALEDVRPPFAKVVHRATVVETLKGGLKIGEKIEIALSTDSLPMDEIERAKFIAKADQAAKGSLRYAFLQGDKLEGKRNKRFGTEFLYLPKYTEEMSDFLGQISVENGSAQVQERSATE